MATALRSSAHAFSSLPAATVTRVPSLTEESSATTRKETGSVLLLRQCAGSAVHSKFGLPVGTRWPSSTTWRRWQSAALRPGLRGTAVGIGPMSTQPHHAHHDDNYLKPLYIQNVHLKKRSLVILVWLTIFANHIAVILVNFFAKRVVNVWTFLPCTVNFGQLYSPEVDIVTE